MKPVIYKQLEKYKDKNGKIVGYLLKDSQGNQMQIKQQDLKKQIKTGAIKVINLTLTKDDRLVDGATEKPKQEEISNKRPDHLKASRYVCGEIRLDKEGLLGYIVYNKKAEYDLMQNDLELSQNDDVLHIMEPSELVKSIRFGFQYVNAYIDLNGKLGINYKDLQKSYEISKGMSKELKTLIPNKNDAGMLLWESQLVNDNLDTLIKINGNKQQDFVKACIAIQELVGQNIEYIMAASAKMLNSFARRYSFKKYQKDTKSIQRMICTPKYIRKNANIIQDWFNSYEAVKQNFYSNEKGQNSKISEIEDRLIKKIVGCFKLELPEGLMRLSLKVDDDSYVYALVTNEEQVKNAIVYMVKHLGIFEITAEYIRNASQIDEIEMAFYNWFNLKIESETLQEK